MKIFAISDTHLSYDESKPMHIFGSVWVEHWQDITADWQDKVADDDIVLIAGDISWAMRLEDAKKDLDAIALNKGTKIIIKGNHDYWWQSYCKINDVLAPHKNFFALQNNAVLCGEYIFCGTRGWTVPEPKQKQKEDDKKIYDREVLRLKMSIAAAKKLQTDNQQIIALMHFPPFNSQQTPNEFTNLFTEHGIKTVVFGHLHGRHRTPSEIIIDDTTYHLTSCDFLQNKLKQII